MRISDGSSDVCSSDLAGARRGAVIDRSGAQIVLAGLDVGDLEIDAVEGVELVISMFLPEGGYIDVEPGAVPFDVVFIGVDLLARELPVARFGPRVARRVRRPRECRDAGGILCIGPRGRAARPVERRIVEVEAARLVTLRRRGIDEPFGRRLPAQHRGARPLALAELRPWRAGDDVGRGAVDHAGEARECL